MTYSYTSGSAPLIATSNDGSIATSTVTSVMDKLAVSATGFTAQLNSVTNALANLAFDSSDSPPVLPDFSNADAIQWLPATPLDLSGLGGASQAMPAVPDPASFAPVNLAMVIAPFSPGVTLNLPSAPGGFTMPNMPSAPVINTSISIPGAPVLIEPVMAALNNITIPSFTFPTLATFNAVAPAFNVAAPSVTVSWREPAYSSENFTEVLSTVQALFAGGTGLPPIIQQQLFDLARAREDVTALKATQEAFDTFASKGFTMPSGMLAQQVNVALEKNQLQANSLNRDILTKSADYEIANLRFAVEQGIAAENILFNIFNNAETRAFEVAKLQTENQITLYNSQVTLFNAYTESYQTQANVYKTVIEGPLAELDIYKSELEGQKIISEINQQLVQTFLAKIQGVQAQVEVYKAQMEGAKIQVEIAETQIQEYKGSVDAFSALIQAERVTYDIYRTQVEAEVSKVGIIDADARVFAVQAQVAMEQVEANIKTAQLTIEQSQATTQRYVAQVEGAKAMLAAQVAVVDANARIAELNIKDDVAQSEMNVSLNETKLRLAEYRTQTALAMYGAQTKMYEVNINKMLEQVKIRSSSLTAAGQMYSTLAGGAMAAQHVQASMSYNSSTTASLSETWSESGAETTSTLLG